MMIMTMMMMKMMKMMMMTAGRITGIAMALMLTQWGLHFLFLLISLAISCFLH